MNDFWYEVCPPGCRFLVLCGLAGCLLVALVVGVLMWVAK